MYKLPYTAAPIRFNLIGGEIVDTGGDIRLTVTRSPGTITGHNRLEWGLLIEAIDGGLMDADGHESTTFDAPEQGYQPSMELIFSTNAPHK